MLDKLEYIREYEAQLELENPRATIDRLKAEIAFLRREMSRAVADLELAKKARANDILAVTSRSEIRALRTQLFNARRFEDECEEEFFRKEAERRRIEEEDRAFANACDARLQAEKDKALDEYMSRFSAGDGHSTFPDAKGSHGHAADAGM